MITMFTVITAAMALPFTLLSMSYEIVNMVFGFFIPITIHEQKAKEKTRQDDFPEKDHYNYRVYQHHARIGSQLVENGLISRSRQSAQLEVEISYKLSI